MIRQNDGKKSVIKFFSDVICGSLPRTSAKQKFNMSV
jgi:hypothetical protein